MYTTTVKVSKTELANMIDRAVEEKILQLLGDPDEKLILKKSLQSRLLRQKKAVAKGQRGEDFSRVVKELGLR
jgi:DNA primase large subunit